jgi:hypothetical protein
MEKKIGCFIERDDDRFYEATAADDDVKSSFNSIYDDGSTTILPNKI